MAQPEDSKFASFFYICCVLGNEILLGFRLCVVFDKIRLFLVLVRFPTNFVLIVYFSKRFLFSYAML